jgi:hypothetical protein
VFELVVKGQKKLKAIMDVLSNDFMSKTPKKVKRLIEGRIKTKLQLMFMSGNVKFKDFGDGSYDFLIEGIQNTKELNNSKMLEHAAKEAIGIYADEFKKLGEKGETK